MKIELTRETRIKLIKAARDGYLDTSEIAELEDQIDIRRPARVLTKEEIRELFDELEENY